MEGKFTIKFDSREAYLEGTVKFLQMLSTWEENQEKYDRKYELTQVCDEENKVYNLGISLNVNLKQ